jgi:hypothetical protein
MECGNYRLLDVVRRRAEEAWRFWLSRRSHKSAISWERFQQLRKVFVLPSPKIVHSL